ncbi:MAG TPA: hypothetical protein VK826_11055 [Bacteroidia bacterium]|nr:hypothetical protein [Bacteroidia bacterium]
MPSLYRNFYRNFYLRTGGFIPAKPLNQNMYPGDFFQIRNGEMIVLGNIFRKGIVAPEEVQLSKGTRLDPANWNFNDGVSKPGRGEGTDGVSFTGAGGFLFRAKNPESVQIVNWNDLQQKLIIQLTQILYSFRELYVVTEVVTCSDSVLVIARSEKADDIEYFHREAHRKPLFFKAKKLDVQNEKREVFASEITAQTQNKNEWANGFFEYEFYEEPGVLSHTLAGAQTSLLDMLKANELNPNTALQYFRWTDANLDDVERLFGA